MNSTVAPSAPDDYTLADFGLIVLRNVSQVVLQNNAISGGVILAAIFYHSFAFGLAALAGSIVSTWTAMFLKTDHNLVKAGLYGFNGVLTAIAIVFYCQTSFDTIDISWWMMGIYVFFGAVFSTMLTAAIGSMLSVADVPPLTAPFVLASWLFVAGTHFSPALSPGHMHPTKRPASVVAAKESADTVKSSVGGEGEAIGQAPDNAAADSDDDNSSGVDDDDGDDNDGVYDIDTWWEGAGKGFGEIFFQDNAISGYLILLAIAINSPISAAMAVVGVLISIGVAESLGIGEHDIHMGMFSYSAILTAIAIGGLFFLLTLRGFIYTVFGIVFTTWLYAALAAVLQPLHLPAYTAPFVLVTWIMLYSKSTFQGLVAIPPAEATPPEGNLKRYCEASQ